MGRWLVYTVIAVLAGPSTARAQEHNSIAVGVNITHRVAPDHDVFGATSVGFKFRLGHSDTGWGWHYGLGWYSANVDRPIGDRTQNLGRLRIKPLLGGYGYTRRFPERMSLTGKVMAGVAFNSFHITPEAVDAFHALPVPLQSVSVDVGLAPVVKPEISFWYDLNRRFGISADVGYSFARPTLTVSSSLGRVSGRVRADAFSFGAGLVFRIF